jgi:DNA replication and repair protein RecF
VLRLTRLRLRDFRSYGALSLDFDAGEVGRITVLTGLNGSGKTNLLEAVSLLMPGRGLRGARVADFPRRVDGASAASWGVAARLLSAEGGFEVGTGSDPSGGERRAFRVDGTAPRSQAEVAALVAVVWLTPQMDGLFQEAASGRRRFLDRLVYALEPSHARQLAAHDNAQAQRSRLLAGGRADQAWLDGLEDSIARHAVAATAARVALVSSLNQALLGGAAAGFPPARMGLDCAIAARLAAGSALAAEDWLRHAQAAARGADAQAGSASLGAQRADMTLADAATGRTADLASTGERKALLIGVVLGHAALIGAQRGAPPILLLDEPMVHLDAARRALLCAAVAGLPGQFLLTGTDPDGFAGLRGAGTFLRTENGALQP